MQSSVGLSSLMSLMLFAARAEVASTCLHRMATAQSPDRASPAPEMAR
jgi:hypothetical protein